MEAKQIELFQLEQKEETQVVFTPELHEVPREEEPEQPTKITEIYKALTQAGWDHRIRRGVRIWCRDARDPWAFWLSEEAAYEQLQKGKA